jgi:hypothetical protein
MSGETALRGLRGIGYGLLALVLLPFLIIGLLIYLLVLVVGVLLGVPGWRARALWARIRRRPPPPPPPPSPPPAGEGPELSPWKVGLEVVGAATGITVFVAFVGGAILWARFDGLGLPADQAVAVMPRSILLTIGAGAITRALILAAAVALAIRLIKPLDENWQPRWTLGVLLRVLVIGELLLLWLVWDLHFWPYALLPAAAALLGAVAVWAAAKRLDGYRPVAWTLFAVIALVGAINAFARTADTPKMEPAALLFEQEDQGLAGFWIGQNSESVYIAPLTTGGRAALGEDVAAVEEIPREKVARVEIGPLISLGARAGGRAEALGLLRELRLERERALNPATARTQPVPGENMAETFAPLIHLHSRDPYQPISADEFLAHSRLLWAAGGDDCSDPVIAAGPKAGSEPALRELDSASLGRGPDHYEHGLGCVSPGQPYRANQHTRPYDRTRAAGLPQDQGFYLDISDERRTGAASTKILAGRRVLTGAPVYYEIDKGPRPERRRRRIIYWFLYAYSVPPGPDAATGRFAHEGDWERISVLVQRRPGEGVVPISVRYHAHNHHVDVAWEEIERVDDHGRLLGVGTVRPDRATHPVGYVARRSHATFPVTGAHESDFRPSDLPVIEVEDEAIACLECPQWHTWELLANARDEGWYGFGGAWGDARGSSDFTGPLGPSQFKLGREDTPPEYSVPEPVE